MDIGAIWWPLLLSTLAGLSTAIGGLIAVSFAPSEGTLAFLLGTAIGVMATVSGVELWWHSAVEQHDFLGITAAVAAGAVLFAVLDPLLPKHDEEHQDSKPQAAAAAAGEVQGAGRQEQHVALSMQPRKVPRSSTDSSNGNANGSSATQHTLAANGSNEAQLAATPLLQEAPSNGTSRPSSSNGSDTNASSRPRSSNSLQQQLPVFAHSQPSAVPVAGSSMAEAAATDAQLEQLPLLDASSTSNSSTTSHRDQQQKGSMAAGSSSLGAIGSRKGVAVSSSSSSIDQSQQGLDQQQQNGEHQHGVKHQSEQQQQQQQEDEAQRLRQHHAGMLRLGMLMTITLTIHNLPEGFAVAFSAFTNIGPIMALAIALHNIPEGLVIAAPLYAATGSKLKALGMTAASGLSEPVGALLALLVFKPFVTSLAQLDYVLAGTGGVMLAVCVLELWPEGRRCGQDVRLLQGMALGTVIMGWTLYVGA